MSARIFFFFLFISSSLFGQQKQCGCTTDSLMNEYTTDCKTTYLTNGFRLYWQFSCNNIWLTLQTKYKKIIIDKVPVEYYSYTYRLGFHLLKEFKNSLLFREDCPANGPCSYTLINKFTGQKIKEFGQIVGSPVKNYPYNFVVYLSGANDLLKIYFPDTGKLLQKHINKNDFFYTVPIDQFDSIQLNKGNLLLSYETSSNDGISHKKKIIIGISKYSR